MGPTLAVVRVPGIAISTLSKRVGSEMHARMPAPLGRALRQAKESLKVTHQRMHSSLSLPHTALLQLIRQADGRNLLWQPGATWGGEHE